MIKLIFESGRVGPLSSQRFFPGQRFQRRTEWRYVNWVVLSQSLSRLSIPWYKGDNWILRKRHIFRCVIFKERVCSACRRLYVRRRYGESILETNTNVSPSEPSFTHCFFLYSWYLSQVAKTQVDISAVSASTDRPAGSRQSSTRAKDGGRWRWVLNVRVN